MRRATMACSLILALFFAVPSRAEHTRYWQESSYEQFDRGTHTGVALRSDGTLLPAPEFKAFADPSLAYVWALTEDSHGRVYAGGGSDAKVLRLDSNGKTTTVFESSELEVQALAADKQDNIYAGTSPDGKVYKITADGQHTTFFDPKARYIWALAFDSKGTLFVATGDKGEIFAVSPDGKGELFYKSEENHARSLAFDSDGNLLVGTDPDGLIIRVPVEANSKSGLPQAGKPFVIYETNKKEVTALITDSKGNIYAAAVGNKPVGGRIGTPQMVGAENSQQIAEALAEAERRAQQGVQTSGTQIVGNNPPIVFPPFQSATGGSEVYRIAPDGSPETLWSSLQDVAYALGFSSEGNLLVGAGNHGQVIEIDGNGVFSSLASADASQVTSLLSGPGKGIYVATANPGKVFTLGPDYAAQGTFESDTFDAKIFSQWGRLSWWGENGAMNDKIEFYVRSGNTSDPDNYWSAWEGPYTEGSGVAVHCPPARFAQWKAVFHTATGNSQPTLAWVKLAYLRKNVAPVIDGVLMQEPGVRVQSIAVGPSEEGQHSSTVTLRVPQSPSEAGTFAFGANFEELQRRQSKFSSPPQGVTAPGYETVVWAAHDDNDDQLVYTLYYRGEGEKEWKLLKDDIQDNYYSWDTQSMPDGAYYLKLVTSDAPSNPYGQALTAEMTSDRFQVDNTPPAVENIRAEASGSEWHIQFNARDSGSAIARSLYSVDAGKWEEVFPVGELTDSPQENYDVALRNLKPGEHTVAIQVFDLFKNSGTGKVTFTVPSAGR